MKWKALIAKLIELVAPIVVGKLSKPTDKDSQ